MRQLDYVQQLNYVLPPSQNSVLNDCVSTMFNNWTMFFRLHKTQISTTAKPDPITPTCAHPYWTWFALLQHGQFSFIRKRKHRYVIWFPLLNHVQFHLSYMRRCSSIANASTVDVNKWRIKGVRTQPCDIWFPLLQHEHFHISCIRRRSSSTGNVSTFMTFGSDYSNVGSFIFRAWAELQSDM